MRSYIKPSSFLLACLALAACGETDDMEKVKGHIFEIIDNSRTLGTAMEKRSACSKFKWSEQEDASGRNLVTFECEIKVESINTTFQRINDKNRNGFEAEIVSLNKREATLKEEIAKLENVASIVREHIPEAIDITKSLSGKKYYKKTPEEAERDESLNNEMQKLMKDVSSQAAVIMSESDFTARDKARRMAELLSYRPYSKGETIEGHIERVMENLIDEHRNSFNLNSALSIAQKNIERFQINPINVSEIKSIVTFSANPSTETPVSIVSSKYAFRNKGADYAGSADININDMYTNNEIYKLKRSIAQIYMDSTGVAFIPNDALRN